MPLSFCKTCDCEFFYDEDLGLNVKFYQSESNAHCFQCSGDFPICPKCDAKCQTEAAINYDKSQIRVEIKFTRQQIS